MKGLSPSSSQLYRSGYRWQEERIKGQSTHTQDTYLCPPFQEETQCLTV